MLTLFTLPRAFAPPFDRIQHNAIASWAALSSKPRLILLGDDTGVSEAAQRYATQHLPELERNHLGTPLVNHLFRSASAHTQTPYQGFVNADIILDPKTTSLLQKIVEWHPRTLIVSRRWDLDVSASIDFSQESAFTDLAERARTEGKLYTHHGMDLFIFPTGIFDDMPPFSIGWPGAKYDNWLVYSARRRGLRVVDITDAVTTVHQNHPTGSSTKAAKAQEHWVNLDLLGGHGCCFDIHDATHVVTADFEIKRRIRTRSEQRVRAFRFAQRLRYRFRSLLLGFRYSTVHANNTQQPATNPAATNASP